MPAEDLGHLRSDTLRRGARVIWRGIRDEKLTFTIAVVGSALYGAGTAAGGWYLGEITERILVPAFDAGRVTGGQIVAAAGGLALITVFTVLGVVARRVAAGMTIYRLQARYRRAVTRQYLRLPLAWHHRHPAGQLLSNANSDVEAIWQVFAPLPMALGVVAMVLVAGVAMVAADPVLALVGLSTLPLLMGANAFFQRRLSPLAMRAQALRGDVSAVAHESLDGALVVKTLGREAAEEQRFGEVAGRLRAANIAAGRVRGLFDAVLEGLPTIGTLAVLAVGALRVQSGAIGPGAVIQIAYLLTLVGFPIRAFGWILGELPRTVVGWERVWGVLQAGGQMPYGDADPAVGDGPAGLAVRGVDYAHHDETGAPVPVLHGVTLDVAPGRTVAVVGPTGSGKSTLTSLLLRLVDPATGAVLLEGVDVRRLRRGGVAQVAALVPQSTFIFDDSVRNNVTLGGDSADDDEAQRVWAALRQAQADGFVAALPAGLETRVGERGTTLSGGQRQRLALARALYRQPRLLVMDDATSAVDPRVEAAILAELRSAQPRPTVVVVAYRRATIALADEVVWVEGGRIADRGRHEDLLDRSPGYRELVTAYEQEGQRSVG